MSLRGEHDADKVFVRIAPLRPLSFTSSVNQFTSSVYTSILCVCAGPKKKVIELVVTSWELRVSRRVKRAATLKKKIARFLFTGPH